MEPGKQLNEENALSLLTPGVEGEDFTVAEDQEPR